VRVPLHVEQLAPERVRGRYSCIIALAGDWPACAGLSCRLALIELRFRCSLVPYPPAPERVSKREDGLALAAVVDSGVPLPVDHGCADKNRTAPTLGVGALAHLKTSWSSLVSCNRKHKKSDRGPHPTLPRSTRTEAPAGLWPGGLLACTPQRACRFTR
jgi:hypothetical protein